MIVSCPSCGTRYKHQSPAGGTAAAARCAQCNHMVPLVVAGRPYLILPAGAGERGGMRIGMDDPTLARQLSRTAFDAGPGEGHGAASYRVESAEAGTSREKGWTRRFSGTNGSAPAIFDNRRSWALSSKARSERKQAGHGTAAPTTARGRKIALELTVIGVLVTVGAATAYFSAAEYGLDPPTWTAAGGGLGLFMSWICLRWTRQH